MSHKTIVVFIYFVWSDRHRTIVIVEVATVVATIGECNQITVSLVIYSTSDLQVPSGVPIVAVSAFLLFLTSFCFVILFIISVKLFNVHCHAMPY